MDHFEQLPNTVYTMPTLFVRHTPHAHNADPGDIQPFITQQRESEKEATQSSTSPLLGMYV